MKKQILSEQFRRMQKLAGIITESQLNKNEIEEAVGNFELKKLAKELYSVIKKVNGVTGVKIVTSDITNAASAFQAVSKKPLTLFKNILCSTPR